MVVNGFGVGTSTLNLNIEEPTPGREYITPCSPEEKREAEKSDEKDTTHMAPIEEPHQASVNSTTSPTPEKGRRHLHGEYGD